MQRVLIVEGADSKRRYLRRTLSDYPLEFDEAHNLADALQLALAAPYDLYLVDVDLPQDEGPLADGLNFLATLRECNDLRQGAAIMYSTRGTPGNDQLAYVAGANVYLTQPVLPDELRQSTRELLARDMDGEVSSGRGVRSFCMAA